MHSTHGPSGRLDPGQYGAAGILGEFRLYGAHARRERLHRRPIDEGAADARPWAPSRFDLRHLAAARGMLLMGRLFADEHLPAH